MAEAAGDGEGDGGARRGRLRATFDRVPTSWLATGLVVVLLGASAAFGGLADAPEPPIATIEAGRPIEGTQLDITVTGATVTDAAPRELHLEPEPGHRHLTVVAEVENVWTTPAGSGVQFGFGGVVRLDGVDDDPVVVYDVDDVRREPTLQPGVPRTLAWVWELPVDELPEPGSGEATVGVRVFDRSYTEGKVIIAGGSFGDPVLAAAGTVAVTEDPAPEPDPFAASAGAIEEGAQ